MSEINKFEGEFYFLSNFSPSTIMYNGEVWPTAEHAFQAAKSEDIMEREMVRACATPGQAKRMGQKVTLRYDWEFIKIDVMRTIVGLKFADPSLGDRLVQTAPRRLVEGNYWGDTFWGVCRGEGENHLGLILMDVRGKLIRKENDGTRTARGEAR